MAKTFNEPATGHQQENTGSAQLSTRKSSKLDLIADLLCSPLGATLEELMATTGWQSHSVRAGMTGLRKQGHSIVRTTGNGVTRFAIAAPTRASAEA